MANKMYSIILISDQGTYTSHFRWALIEMLKNSAKHRYITVKSHNMCAWRSSFQWFKGIIGGSTSANRPNRRCRGGRLLGATCEIIGKKTTGRYRLLGHGGLNRDNTVLNFAKFTKLNTSRNEVVLQYMSLLPQ